MPRRRRGATDEIIGCHNLSTITRPTLPRPAALVGLGVHVVRGAVRAAPQGLRRFQRRAVVGAGRERQVAQKAVREAMWRRHARAALRARETPENLAQDAFRTAREKLAQERSELAKTLADASAKPSQDT